MANSYTQIVIHLVFVVKYRQALITTDWEENLFRFLAGVLKNKGQKPIIINGNLDHIHLLVGMTGDLSVSELVRELKKSSTNYINQNRFTGFDFKWQNGFGAFSIQKSIVKTVYNYILNQKKHHKSKTLKNEFLDLLEYHGVEYDEKYLFEWPLD